MGTGGQARSKLEEGAQGGLPFQGRLGRFLGRCHNEVQVLSRDLGKCGGARAAGSVARVVRVVGRWMVGELGSGAESHHSSACLIIFLPAASVSNPPVFSSLFVRANVWAAIGRHPTHPSHACGRAQSPLEPGTHCKLRTCMHAMHYVAQSTTCDSSAATPSRPHHTLTGEARHG